MALYFLDTSALVKYYVIEPGSSWISSLIDASTSSSAQLPNTIVIAELSLVEAAAAFAILHRMHRLGRSLRDTAFSALESDISTHQYRVMRALSADISRAARLTQTHPMKAYDAVQLAIALRLKTVLQIRAQDTIFVSGDRTQLTAAKSEGLLIENPFDHVQPQDNP